MPASAASAARPRRGSPWILGPGHDLAWFLLAPAWILALVWSLRDWPVLGIFGGTLLAVGAAGHHLPGFLRAYGDPVLFRRFRARLLLAPAFFLGICAVFAVLHLRGLELILVLWGAWHGAMQVHGFARIYDAKAGSTAPATARLDGMLCATWFAGGLLHSEPKLHLLGLTLHRAGWPLPSPEALAAVRHAWTALAVLVTAAFLVNAAMAARKGRGANPRKVLCLAVSFAFWWFCMVEVKIALLGLLLFEIFHDVQYNVLVWAYQRARVASGLPTGLLERLLFRPSAARLAAYLGLILAYGALGAASQFGTLGVPDAARESGWVSFLSHLFMASAFLHFYYDAFIWKVREPAVRGALGLAGPMAPAVDRHPAPSPSRARTAFQAALFAVAVAGLGYSEHRGGSGSPLEAHRSLAALLPGTWEVHLALGSLELEAGNPGAGAAGLRKASELNPRLDIGGPRTLARLYLQAGDTARAVEAYRRAVDRSPDDAHARYDLGLLLRSQGRLAEAIPELRAVADRHPGDGGTNYSAGYALLLAGQVPQAIPYLERCVSADPRHKRGWNYLGVAREARGSLEEAKECYRRALAVDTAFAEARRNLRQAELRSRDAAGGRSPALPEDPLGQGARRGEVVLEPGQVRLHPDGVALPPIAGAEVDPARIMGSAPRTEPDAVHGDGLSARTDPFAEGSQHLRLDLVPGHGTGRQQGCEHGERRKAPGYPPDHAGKSSKTSERVPTWIT